MQTEAATLDLGHRVRSNSVLLIHGDHCNVQFVPVLSPILPSSKSLHSALAAATGETRPQTEISSVASGSHTIVASHITVDDTAYKGTSIGTAVATSAADRMSSDRAPAANSHGATVRQHKTPTTVLQTVSSHAASKSAHLSSPQAVAHTKKERVTPTDRSGDNRDTWVQSTNTGRRMIVTDPAQRAKYKECHCICEICTCGLVVACD